LLSTHCYSKALAHDVSPENNLSNPPLPPFSKGGNFISPFEKGGLRGIIFMHICEPQAHDGSLENPFKPVILPSCHPELVSGSPNPALF